MLLLTGCGGGGGGGSSAQPPVISVSAQPSNSELGINQGVQLVATPEDSMGNPLPGRAVIWASSNTAVATVTSTGLVMALSVGQATITATSEMQSGTAAITIVTGIVLAQVSAGGSHTCGVSPYGVPYATYCWGDNSSGQLGNGTTTNSATPVPVSGGFNVGAVSAGGNHTCGIGYDGAAYCWGDNSFGQLGDGTNTNRTAPVAVLGGLQFNILSAGNGYTCGVTFASAAYCWGNNSFGQLGNGTTTNSAVPVAVSGEYSQISAGSDHTCTDFVLSMLDIGQMYCWGDNSSGQLGNGTTTNSSLPIAPMVGNSVYSMTAGANYTCAVNFDGGTFCWGNNSVGQLGNGTMTNSAIPVAVAGGLQFNSFSLTAGTMHICGISFGKVAYCWGGNSFGQLGDGTTTNRAQPVAVAGALPGYYSLSAGGGHTCVVTDSPGPAYCWGNNNFGQLGNGTSTNSPLPVLVANAP